MALYSLHCADMLLRNCLLAHYIMSMGVQRVTGPNFWMALLHVHMNRSSMFPYTYGQPPR